MWYLVIIPLDFMQKDHDTYTDNSTIGVKNQCTKNLNDINTWPRGISMISSYLY